MKIFDYYVWLLDLCCSVCHGQWVIAEGNNRLESVAAAISPSMADVSSKSELVILF